jgi:hypothetical protein
MKVGISILLITHGILAVLLLGAITHQAIAAAWPATKRAPAAATSPAVAHRATAGVLRCRYGLARHNDDAVAGGGGRGLRILGSRISGGALD